MRLSELVETSRRVAATSGRLEKIHFLAECLRRLAPEEIEIGVGLLSGEPRQGRIGVGYAAVHEAYSARPAPSPVLTLRDVDDALERLAHTRGAGSAAERARILAELFTRATEDEQDFLSRLMRRELRQGALEGLILEALARAAEVPATSVRRAAMITGNLTGVAQAALVEGLPGLKAASVQLFHAFRPMLADSADEVTEALSRLEQAALEYKLDGARIQVHKDATDVRVFSRGLNDVTAAAPEIVEAVRKLPARQLILDGEALVLGEDQAPAPFQTTMRRLGRKLDVERLRESLPLRPFFFDCLYLDGESLMDRPGAERFRVVTELLPGELVVPRIVTGDPQQASSFLEQALDLGHEGVMAKSLVTPYEPGGRSRSWLKVKPAHTLDLVVLAAEWGHGRRQGWLSNLHLGARDPSSGQYVMLGKTFKGMTDEMLRWQTEKLLELETSRGEYTVYVRPELVVEVAFNEIQTSSHYPGGMALRFARVKRYRPDKLADDANTLDTVRAIRK